MTAIPPFITRPDISQLSHDELTELVEALRERRLRAFVVYSEAEEKKQEIREERLRDQLEKANAMLLKEINKVDKFIDALSARVTKVQVIRMELGLDPGKGMEG